MLLQFLYQEYGLLILESLQFKSKTNLATLFYPHRGITGSNDELFSSSGAHAADGAASAAVPSSYALNLDMGLAEHTAEYSAAVEAPAHEIFFQGRFAQKLFSFSVSFRYSLLAAIFSWA